MEYLMDKLGIDPVPLKVVRRLNSLVLSRFGDNWNLVSVKPKLGGGYVVLMADRFSDDRLVYEQSGTVN